MVAIHLFTISILLCVNSRQADRADRINNIKQTWQNRKGYRRTEATEACKYDNARSDTLQLLRKLKNHMSN